MSISDTATTVTVDPRQVSGVHFMYALHAMSIAIGLLTAASITGKFVFGLPSIIAVVMNYLRRPEVRGTWIDTHFGWQRRTFWIAAIPAVLVGPLKWTIVLIPLVWFVYAVIGLWVTYRMARGWLALKEGRSMPNGGF